MERSSGFVYGVGRWKFRIGLLFAVTVPIALVATIAGTKDAPSATGCTIDGNAVTTSLPQGE